ncbi:MAG: hypothetical protein Q9201_006311 [Fulgogasparrea decipioides]
MASGSEDFEEFARITPEGTEAEEALDLVYADDNLHEYHRSFIQVEKRTRPKDSSSELSSSGRRTPPNPDYWGGHYKLSLRDPVEKPFSHGWRMGRGLSKKFEGAANPVDRGVDLLLIRAGGRKQHVAAVHARIQIHPRSGALMLFGVQADKPVLYKVHDQKDPVILQQGQSHVLYQKSNLFFVGSLRYTLDFADFTDEQYSSFVRKRNAMLCDHGFLAPHPELSAVWRRQDVKRGRVVTHGPLASGKFGWVFSAVHARSGEPLAVKEHRPQDKHEMNDVAREIRENQGLLPTIRSWCDHEFDLPCNKIPQSVFASSPLAASDFSSLLWTEYETRQILDFFRGPLEGLSNLHAAGYMHRDVHVKNLFVMSLNPPRAVLGDFGKTIKAEKDKNPYLGPAYTCAPEVNASSHGTIEL